MILQTPIGNYMEVTHLMKLLVGVVQRSERKESCLLKGVKSVSSIHADMWCHICRVAFMNLLFLDYTLLIIMGVFGPEEMPLKIKGSGDVKVVSWVIRHRRLQLQAVMSARQAD